MSGYSVDIVRKDFAVSEGCRFLQKAFRQESLGRLFRECLDR